MNVQDVKKIVITHKHERGFAFAVVEDTGEQVFIPPHAANTCETGFEAGDFVGAILVPNAKDTSDRGTPWLAARLTMCTLLPDETPFNLGKRPARAPNLHEWDTDALPDEKPTTLDERAYAVLADVSYASNADLAGWLGADKKSVSNAMQRLYNAGRISRAEVYQRVGQQRASFVLYAINANDFIAEEDEDAN
tara:strand:- start:3894 stop:4472 length:579 start_codon:yes stop_codon:yes gene_type:complete